MSRAGIEWQRFPSREACQTAIDADGNVSLKPKFIMTSNDHYHLEGGSAFAWVAT